MSVTLARLAELAGGRLVGPEGLGSVAIADVIHDSRLATPGSIFVAVPGSRHDGHRFVDQAVAAGCPAVCVEHQLATAAPQLVVGDTRAALSALAAEVHGHPSRDISLVGVTGTNGKTTVTYLVESICRAAGWSTGLIGTIETRVAGRSMVNPHTTPEASDFQRLLRAMVEAGARAVATEVSSHALSLGRVDHTWFSVAAFTNLSQDHLDLHGTMEAYEAAKASLFQSERTGLAVIFVDDPAGERLAAQIAVPAIRVSRSGSTEVGAGSVTVGLRSSKLAVRLPDGTYPVMLNLGGDHNVENALVAAGCGVALGIPGTVIAEGLQNLRGIPGRLEVVSGDDPVTVIVDYAHTPQAMMAVVRSARATTSGRVMIVVGAGGDRDRGKRRSMGTAASGADLAVITSDNPRSEDPDAIISEVVAGILAGTRHVIQADRRQAIRSALVEARGGDVVLILGKGHEQGQEREGVVTPFDDRQVASEELTALRQEVRA
ncbi:MAG TPA: UDP-N-acetylmuramoyl-L-alanyl-D-glutamate--2,6-diaminopimelate ligase [Acidimicrobiia bacterium]|nr:UDP-N-acetylmuramoyl-L-alanyl-D-glutamate--2,6-diaminopimelate ligase [Acidimicrobiia bacterium]